MSLKDILNASKIREENDRLKQILTPEMQNIIDLQNVTAELNRTITELQSEVQSKQNELQKVQKDISEKRSQLIVMDDEILVQEFGLYKPTFDFATSLDYKEELAKIRSTQKELIKNKRAVTGNTAMQFNGSSAKGKKMVGDTQKLLLRAFNNECDDIVSKVKYTNFDSSLNRIYKSAEAISKLGNMMSIAVTKYYIDAKVKELRLAFEYQQKKQQEKEELKLAREEQREQAKAQKEIEEQKRKIEKEQNHYQSAYENY